jgi:hypothetical protein
MEPILELLQKAFSVGFDSLLAGIAIGPIIVFYRNRLLFALLFGVCDGLATLLGALAPHRLPGAPAAELYLLAVLLIIQGSRHGRTWLLALPLLLAFDNFAVGGTIADVPLLALSSAAMAAVGMALGRAGRRLAGRIWTTEGAV